MIDPGDAQEHQLEVEASYWTCARCKRTGSLYDAEFARPEGRVCWVCVDDEPEIPNRTDVEHVTEEMAWDNLPRKER